MKRTIVFVLAVALIAPSVFAQMMGGQHGSMMNDKNDTGKMMPMMDGNMMMDPLGKLMDLGLDDDQIERLIEIQSEHMKEAVPRMRRMNDQRQQLMQLKQAENPDYDQLEEAMVAMSRAEAKMMKNMAETRREAMDVLTPEQKEKLGDRPLPMPMHMSMNCPMMQAGGMMDMMKMMHGKSGMMGSGMMGGSGDMSGMKSGAGSGTDHESHH